MCAARARVYMHAREDSLIRCRSQEDRRLFSLFLARGCSWVSASVSAAAALGSTPGRREGERETLVVGAALYRGDELLRRRRHTSVGRARVTSHSQPRVCAYAAEIG